MYIRHIPKYTGFGLGADQPIVLPSLVSPRSTGTPPSVPLVLFGQSVNWTQVFGAAGALLIAILAFRGVKRGTGWASETIRKGKSKRAAQLRAQAALAEL
jgi:hypothetical protein